MTKRVRVPGPAKPGEQKVSWGRPGAGQEPAVCYCWGGKGADKSDSRLLCMALEDTPIYEGRSLVEELERRGYDITTLKVTIQMKKDDTL